MAFSCRSFVLRKRSFYTKVRFRKRVMVTGVKMWNLSEAAIKELQNLPETGMGFLLVEATIMGNATRLLVLDSEPAIDLSQIELTPGDDPAVILHNGIKVIEALKVDTVRTMFAAPGPHSFRLLQTRIGPLPSGSVVAGASVRTALPSSLVKHDKLKANRVFYRYSAFNLDKRVDPVTGSFLPGTYAAPESEIPFVPTGFLAVGRFALPNVLPASFRYEITAPVGTVGDFGSVAPAYGQSGGGVEAYFASAVTNAAVPPAPFTGLPDE